MITQIIAGVGIVAIFAFAAYAVISLSKHKYSH